MMQLTPEKAEWLYALQRPWPLVERPLQAIATQLATTEATLCAFIEELRAQGIVRRIGAIFDARRLGYRSCLFAIRAATPDGYDAIAPRVCAQPGVTHAYRRAWPEGWTTAGITSSDYTLDPQLWYTLSARSDRYDEALAPLAHLNPIPFPAIKRYKIDVVFDPRTRTRDERTEYRAALPSVACDVIPAPIPTPEQQAIVRRYQDDTASIASPFEDADLPQLRAWQADGTLRRFALLLHHRASGFTANGMCCWCAPEALLDTLGRRLALEADVTHCYARPSAPNFPYNLYAMIHKQSWQSAFETYQRLTALTQLPLGKIYFSTHEYKKTSLRCFV